MCDIWNLFEHLAYKNHRVLQIMMFMCLLTSHIYVTLKLKNVYNSPLGTNIYIVYLYRNKPHVSVL